MRQLILVHGRAQENKDGAALKKEWIAAWEKGLKKSDLKNPLEDKDIHFPYYGNTLIQMLGGKTAAEAAEVIVKGPPPVSAEEVIMREMLTEIARAKGVSDADIKAELGADAIAKGPLNWGWVQGIMRALDKLNPISSEIVKLVTADVAKYLSNPATQKKINDGVLGAIKPGQEAVIVSHSLGTVVAYQVLMSRPTPFAAVKVPLFVTLGSPLAVNAVQTRIAPHTFPKSVGEWYNARDPNDVVPLYALNKKHFDTGGKIENYEGVDNRTGNQHGIAGYLDDEHVAKRIYDALSGV